MEHIIKFKSIVSENLLFQPFPRLRCDFYTNVVSLKINHIDNDIIKDFLSNDDTKLRELISSELRKMGVDLCIREVLSVDSFCGI